jgi:hypothetical protein
VRVRDVGVLSDSSDIQTNVVRTDGKRSVYLRVNKQPIANTVEVVDALRKAIPKMIGIPPGVQLGISFDQSIYIRQSIKNLIEQALHGSLLAAAVILLFLRNLTSTLIISVAIPLSILVTFIVLYFHQPDAECLHDGRIGPGHRSSGGRFHRRIGKHSAPFERRPEPLGRHRQRRPRSGHADLRLYGHDRRRLPAHVFHRRVSRGFCSFR